MRIPKRITVREGEINYSLTLENDEIFVHPGLVHKTERRPWVNNPITGHIEGKVLKPGNGIIKVGRLKDGRYKIIEKY